MADSERTLRRIGDRWIEGHAGRWALVERRPHRNGAYDALLGSLSERQPLDDHLAARLARAAVRGGR